MNKYILFFITKMKFIYYIFYNIIFTLIHAKNSKNDISTNSSNTITYSTNIISSSIIKSTLPSNENELLISSFSSTFKNTKTTINLINYSSKILNSINNSIMKTQIKNNSLLLINSTNILTQEISHTKSSLINYTIKNSVVQTSNSKILSDKIIYNLYFLQAQLIGYQLKIYMLCDFEISKEFSFLVTIFIYNKSMRFLEQIKKKVNASYNNNYKNISEFIIELNKSDLTENSVVEIMEINIQNTSEYQFIPKFGENIIKNTENITNEINFTKIIENRNYTFYKYEVESISKSNNCSFIIKIRTNISDQLNKNLTLIMEGFDQKSKVYLECNFSYIYLNEIPCSLNGSENIINGRYILKEKIYPEINELIHIISLNETMDYNIFCDEINLHKDKIRSIITFRTSGNQIFSTGVIVIIIIVCILIVCVIVVLIAFLFINKNRMLKIMKNNLESEKNMKNEMIMSSTTKIS